MRNDQPLALSALRPDGGAPPNRSRLQTAIQTGEGRKLVVVARDQFDLWWQLCQALTTADGVEVVLDRRQGGRWQSAESQQRQERGHDRRDSPNGESDLSGRAFRVFPRPALAARG
jgi:hypothetical protein